MKRRTLLAWLGGILGSTAMGVLVYPLVRFLAPPGTGTAGGEVTLAKTAVPVGTARSVVVRGNPVFVINRAGKGWIALSRVCTHLGCLVDFDAPNNRLLCPCHGGTYNLDGAVLSGPPPAPLKEFPVRVDDDQLVIG